MIIQSIKMAWSSISSSKMRSFLTMLGIIIGVIALVVLVSLVNGATTSVTDQVESLGNSMLQVTINDDGGNPLRLAELEALEADENIREIAPVQRFSSTAKHGYETANVTLYGTTSNYMDIQGIGLKSGRFLKTTDIENTNHVLAISAELADELYGTQNVLGETLSIGGRNFTIIGVMEEDKSMMTTLLGSYTAYIPYSVATRMTGDPSSYVTTFYAAGVDPNSMDSAEAAMKNMLMTRFNQDKDAFTLINQSAMIDVMSNITGTLSLLLGGIAAISLLVGGIGIMNIMLVSVTERTREIGIRKAVGATRGSIMMQFLIEALMISLIGCIIGIASSWVLLQVASWMARDVAVTFVLSGGVVFVSVMFSLIIGLAFGLYPANKAAKMHPIEALRYE